MKYAITVEDRETGSIIDGTMAEGVEAATIAAGCLVKQYPGYAVYVSWCLINERQCGYLGPDGLLTPIAADWGREG